MLAVIEFQTNYSGNKVSKRWV